MWGPTSVREENEIFFTMKRFKNFKGKHESKNLKRKQTFFCVLVTLRGSLTVKTQIWQYLLAVKLDSYKWYRAKHQAVCQRGR